mmetsp:Transcript_19449/g.43172  ORF Transcript_19449/g.43172 Transcript_19449/m.43172 type:complete len:102 (+) Transcript_19449:160-465(+)
MCWGFCPVDRDASTGSEESCWSKQNQEEEDRDIFCIHSCSAPFQQPEQLVHEAATSSYQQHSNAEIIFSQANRTAAYLVRAPITLLATELGRPLEAPAPLK